MNFLGHLFLSGEDDEVILGNFIADHVKGKSQLEYSPGVIKGIQLHRAIDHFTDNHPVVLQGVRRLNVVFGHYGTVISDMFYDHFLASLWEDYHDVSLEKYSLGIYERLLPNLDIMPERTQRMFSYMVRNNWLVAYAKTEGLNGALNGMATRSKFNSGMENATAYLVEHYAIFREEFRLFIPDIIAYTDDWKREREILL
jgi:acyl carrier protein phosphodiesterase